MAHHRRGKPKSARAGCLMCKYFKHQAHKDSFQHQTEQVKKQIISEREQLSDME
jgi:hypothetical protein